MRTCHLDLGTLHQSSIVMSGQGVSVSRIVSKLPPESLEDLWHRYETKPVPWASAVAWNLVEEVSFRALRKHYVP